MHVEGGRSNQRRRTRKDLLLAASRLMKRGKTPTLEEIAEEALVSRATAYRYFPSVEALHLEAAIDVTVPTAEEIFRGASETDAVERVQRVDAALDEMIRANEMSLRMMLAKSLERVVRGEFAEGVPARQNRRTPLIEAALAPLRGKVGEAELDRLAKALALIVGTEGMVVMKDVLGVGEEEAREVKEWAIGALVKGTQKGL